MGTGIKSEGRGGRYRYGSGIKYIKGRRIKLAMGVIALIIMTIASLYIYNSLLDRSKVSTKAEVIPHGQIELPDWITEDLLPVNEYSRPGIALDEITGFVVHYTANPGTSARQNRGYFAGLAETGQTYASSNFIVDLGGEIMLCVPMDEMAYASNTRNNDTLSIEVCHPDETGEFSEEARESVVKLLIWLCETYKISPDTIIRHGDIVDKACPLYYMESPDEWEKFLEEVSSQISYK